MKDNVTPARDATYAWAARIGFTAAIRPLLAQSGRQAQGPLLNDPEVMARALERRREQQISEAAKSWTVFHDFSFTNMVSASGIEFRHHVVDDAGKYYKPVHYDHGNGMAVAD